MSWRAAKTAEGMVMAPAWRMENGRMVIVNAVIPPLFYPPTIAPTDFAVQGKREREREREATCRLLH